jgi:predicted O-methyltransferase YrrM
MSTLTSPHVASLLDRLFAEADRNDPAAFDRFRSEAGKLGGPPTSQQRADLMREIFMPITPDVGRLLYILARNRGAGTIVEFGTSFGISGIHLAAALRDGGGGRLITTELSAAKAARATENFRSAGLDDLIDVRVGDAFDTLKEGVADKIDVLLLDGWKQLYLPLLKFLEPRLAPGALVIGDDLDVAPADLNGYLDYVRDSKNGYVSVELPIGDRIEVSLRAAGP